MAERAARLVRRLSSLAQASQTHLIQKQLAAPMLFASLVNHAAPLSSNLTLSTAWSAPAMAAATTSLSLGASSSLAAATAAGNDSSMPSVPELCAAQPLPATWEIVVGVCVAVGMLISYLPQVIKIFARRSSEGLSAYYLLLGEISCFSVFSNSMVLQYDQLECCSLNGAGWCAASLLSSTQLGVQFFMFSIMYLSFLIFYPSHLKHDATPQLYTPPNALSSDEEDDSLDSPTSKLLAQASSRPRMSREYRTTVITFLVCAGYFVLCLSMLTGLGFGIGPKSDEIRTFAAGLGLVSMVVSVFMYVPQIWRTWKAQDTGALSILMMCIQTPGTVVLTVFLATRPNSSWSTWLTYVATGFLQGTLLSLCVYLTLKKRRQKASRPMFADQEDDYDWMDERGGNEGGATGSRSGGRKGNGMNASINAVYPKDEVLR